MARLLEVVSMTLTKTDLKEFADRGMFSGKKPRVLLALGLWAVAALLLAAGEGDSGAGPKTRPENSDSAPASDRIARLVRIPLPIAGTVDTGVKRMVDQLLEELPKNPAARPVLVFEFHVKEGESSEGSEFERALSLARYLASERLSRVRTIAYLPHTVRGHAVLAALACEEIIMHPDAELGEAGLDEPFIDPTIRRGYTEIAERRRIIPTPVVLGMLDKGLEVFRVKTLDGPRYVLAEEMRELEQSGAAQAVDTIIGAGEFGRLSGERLRQEFRFVSHLASDRSELARALELRPGTLEQDPSLGGEWRALRIDVRGPINPKNISWIERGLNEKLAAENINLLLVWIESPGGSPLDSIRLANTLAALDGGKVRTVAYVPHEARADAALVAFACDHLVMAENALLGGSGAKAIDRGEQKELRFPIKELSSIKERNWSLAAALVDPQLKIHRYAREGRDETRFLSDEEASELKDADKWKRGGEVETRAGVRGRQAEEMRLARFLAGNYDELKQLYHLEREPESLRPNWAYEFIEVLADPKLAGVLLFLAWFFLFIEFMQPGLSVAGFISGLCFLLFFWSQFLHGTAGWLEVLLFLGGALCIAIEFFVTPGTGVFGVGGAGLIIISIVLASQTFIIPRNSYQLEQLPYSLAMVFAGIAGGVTSLILMRRFLPDAPLFRRMMLKPPEGEQLSELDRREALAEFTHLQGKRGETITRLIPSGKARFGDELVDVLSEGDFIPRGAAIYVCAVRGNHVIVRPLEEGQA